MKIIEALKKIKDLKRKADDLKGKITQYCADMECDSPTYTDQKRQVTEWLQAHSDIIKEILKLKFLILKTNVNQDVTIEINNKFVTKTIAEWVIRRRELVSLEEQVWRGLTDRGLRDSKYKLTNSAPEVIVKVRLYFDAAERDKKVDEYRTEPSLIDSALEITNAVTELLG
jgi:hypothetical protein